MYSVSAKPWSDTRSITTTRRQVYEDQVQFLPLFNLLFLQLYDCKDHVDGTSVLQLKDQLSWELFFYEKTWYQCTL